MGVLTEEPLPLAGTQLAVLELELRQVADRLGQLDHGAVAAVVVEQRADCQPARHVGVDSSHRCLPAGETPTGLLGLAELLAGLPVHLVDLGDCPLHEPASDGLADGVVVATVSRHVPLNLVADPGDALSNRLLLSLDLFVADRHFSSISIRYSSA